MSYCYLPELGWENEGLADTHAKIRPPAISTRPNVRDKLRSLEFNVSHMVLPSGPGEI